MSDTQIKPISKEDAQRRLRLRVAAKVMIYLAFAAVAYVFISALLSGDGEVPTVPSKRVDIENLQPGQANFLTWEGRAVLVYRRTDADVLKLRSDAIGLKDPASDRSDQPTFAQNPQRSLNIDYFVAIALGTGQGCTVQYLPKSEELFQGRAWAGGFMDSCGEDRYDVAGRVFDGQYASKNLQVPQYSIDANTLILGR